jgi:arsenate reductase-like glutaredoxin family protein
MAQNPNLIRRPIIVRGAQILIGFDEAAYRNLAK